jgi:hypothetical protein
LPDKNAAVKTPLQKYLRRLKLFTLVQIFSTITAVILTILAVESIVVSAAILILIGITTTVYGIRCGLLKGAFFGLSVALISIFCVALIVITGWRPSQAQEPISAIMFYYGVLVGLPLGIVTLFGIKSLEKA